MSTKIHAAGDALGNPVRLIASPGQRNDIAFAHDLVDGFDAGATIADKGYDADHLCAKIADTGAQIVIPPKRNRKMEWAPRAGQVSGCGFDTPLPGVEILELRGAEIAQRGMQAS